MAHRQSALMAVSERTNPGRYRFYLQNSTYGLLEIGAPDGWNSAKYQIKRDTKYWGVTRVISFNDLIFLKAARDYIKDVYESQGINALITFTVTRLDDTTGAYINYFTGKLDLTTYNIEQIGVHCQVLDTSFTEKVRNRENTKVNIFDTTTVNGGQLPPMYDATTGYEQDWRLEFPAFNLYRYVWYYRNEPWTTTGLSHYVPLLLSTFGVFAEAQDQEIGDTDPMFLASQAERTIQLWGTISGTVTMETTTNNITLDVYLYVNGAVEKTWHFTGGFIDIDTYKITFLINIAEEFTLNAGQDISLRAVVTPLLPPATDITTVYDATNKVKLSEVTNSLTNVRVKSYPIYESFLRTVQKITDKWDCFYSEYFGRTDSQINTYDADGQLGHIVKGRYIKYGEPYPYVLKDSDVPMSLSLSELFDSLDSIFCLGLAVETVGGIERVRVEERRYFFSDTVVLDLSSRIVDEVISKEVVPDLHYSSVEAGYNSFEYLTATNVKEFNAKSAWTTVISVLDKKLDIVCKYRGDTNGINLLRAAGESEDNDTKGEEDIYIVDSIRKGSTPYWQVRVDEGFDAITGEFGIEKYYNLFLTPARAVLRWGAIIRAGLEKMLGTYLRWQAADKNTSLTTELTGEDPVSENVDILVNDLEAPWYCPEYYTVECVMYPDELETIKTNPKGLIKIAADKYGWIWELNMEAEENKVSLKLLRANLDVVTPA